MKTVSIVIAYNRLYNRRLNVIINENADYSC